jgi:cytosine/adenosine deaminase-related metal-dependent hydrolase
MELLLRGKYVLTSAADTGALTDAAVRISGDTVAEVGDWTVLRQAHPDARVVGNGRQLILPHVRSGCTTLHHMGFDTEGPRGLDLCERAIRTYLDGGIRLAFSPGVRNVDKLVLDFQAFLATLPADLRAFLDPLVNLDSAGMERDYFDLFDHLYRKFNSENNRILLSPSWAQAVTESFLARTRETADRLGKVPIHMHCLQTPIHKAFSLRRYGQTAVAWLDERGLIDERVSLGHAIWVTDRDIDILAARRASITTHPSCNLGMRNGLAPCTRWPGAASTWPWVSTTRPSTMTRTQ